jgi:hypothetical protein
MNEEIVNIPLMNERAAEKIIITSFSARKKVTEAGKYSRIDIPYINCNITFKVDKEADPFTWDRYIRESSYYCKMMVVDDEKEYDRYLNGEIENTDGNMSIKSVVKDPLFDYLEKFETFHFRGYVADCTVTNAVLDELRYYNELGRFPSTYRHNDGSIFLRHIKTLDEFWD